MAWTTPVTVIPGELATVAFWHEQVRDNLLFLHDDLFPPATITWYGGAAAPTGWLLCDGTSYLRADYNALFTAMGGASSPYGLPDGTHFKVPDSRGRALVGAGTGGGLTPRSRGDLVGVETTALSIAELAAHTHPGSSGSFSGTPQQANITTFPTWQGYARDWVDPDEPAIWQPVINGTTTKTTDNFTPAGSISVTLASQGSDTAHNTMAPSWVANYIIKT